MERLVKPKFSGGLETSTLRTETAREALRTALRALEGVPDGNVVPDTHIMTLVDAYNNMVEVERTLPSVDCWCVVKHYSNEHEGVWRPAVWVGCTTKEQAEAFAPVIEEHYAREYQHHQRDRFVAERAPCRIGQIVDPKQTAQEYVNGLPQL